MTTALTDTNVCFSKSIFFLCDIVCARVLDACDRLSDQGERVTKCLHHQMQQQNRANEMSHEIAGAFQIGVKKLVHLKSEVADLKKVVQEINLADKGLDSTNM